MNNGRFVVTKRCLGPPLLKFPFVLKHRVIWMSQSCVSPRLPLCPLRLNCATSRGLYNANSLSRWLWNNARRLEWLLFPSTSVAAFAVSHNNTIVFVTSVRPSLRLPSARYNFTQFKKCNDTLLVPTSTTFEVVMELILCVLTWSQYFLYCNSLTILHSKLSYLSLLLVLLLLPPSPFSVYQNTT